MAGPDLVSQLLNLAQAMPSASQMSSQPLATGQNLGGTTNFWGSSDFLNSFQNDFYAPTTTNQQRANWFNEKKDGVALWDDPTGQGAYRVGDVFKDQQVVGNLKDQYGEQAAGQYLLPLMGFDATEQQKMKPEQVWGHVQAKSQEANRNFQNASTRAETNQKIEDQKEEWGDKAPILGMVAGAGQAMMAASPLLAAGPAGIAGVVAAGAVGAGAAWANQDEIVDSMARAKVMGDLAREDAKVDKQPGVAGLIANLGTKLGGAAKTLEAAGNLQTNLWHGSQEFDEGQAVGDSKSAYYAVDADGVKLRSKTDEVINFAATFSDYALRSISPLSRTVLGLEQKVGGISNATAAAAAGGEMFDERSGQYKSFLVDEEGRFDPIRAASGVGTLGIDVAQGFMLPGLSASRAAKESAEQNVLHGLKYKLDDQGKAIGSFSLKDVKPTVALVTPSDQFMTANAMLHSVMAKGGKSRVSADDVYQAGMRLASTDSKWRNMLVTGLAEGYEEAWQAALEPVAMGYRPEPEEIAGGFFAGVAMGAGMAAGTQLTMANADTQMSKVARSMLEVERGQTFSDQDWTKLWKGDPNDKENFPGLTTQEKKNILAQDPEVFEGLRRLANDLVRDDESLRFTSQIDYERIVDMKAMQLEKQLKSSDLPVDGSYRIVQENANLEDHQDGMSLRLLGKRLESKLTGIKEQIEQLAGNAAADQIAVLQHTELLLKKIQDAERIYYGAKKDGTPAMPLQVREEMLQKLNADMQQMWEIQPAAPGEHDTIQARAVALLSLRNPLESTGSYSLALPQISLDATRMEADGTILMPWGPTKGMGADFDGDKIAVLQRNILDDNTFRNLRTGRNQLTANNKARVTIPTTEFDERCISLVAAVEAQQEADAMQINLVGVLEALEQQLKRTLDIRYGFPLEKRDAVIREFFDQLHDGNTKAKERFLSRLADEFPVAWDTMADETLIHPGFLLNSMIRASFRTLRKQHAIDVDSMKQSKKVRTNCRPVPLTGDHGQKIRTAAANMAQKIDMMFPGVSMFRKFQHLHYSDINSIAERIDNPDELFAAYESMKQLYRQISSGKFDDARTELSAKDSISRRVIAQLQASAKDGVKKGQRIPLATFANLSMPNLRQGDPDRGEAAVVWADGPSNLTFVQFLLREAVNVEKKRLESDPEAVISLNKLLSLNPGEAFCHVFNGMKMVELLGDAGAVIGLNMTVGQWRKYYVNLGDRARQAYAKALREDARYLWDKGERHNLPYTVEEYTGEKTGKPISEYQSVVDALLEAGNSELTWNRTEGTVGGRIGRESNTVSKKLTDSFTRLRELGRTLGINMDSEKAWNDLLNERKDLGTAFLKMLPDDVVRAAYDSKGQPLRWVYKVLTLKDPKEAEAYFWRRTLLAKIQTRGLQKNGVAEDMGFFELDDRWLQLVNRLARASSVTNLEMERFEKNLLEMRDVDAFVSWVNNEVRENEAPFTAWCSDVAELDPTYTTGGWSKALPGTAQRDAIKDFYKRVETTSTEIETRLKLNAVDAPVIRLLKDGIEARKRFAAENSTKRPKDRTSIEGFHDSKLVVTLERILERKGQEAIALGPSALQRVVMGSAHGIMRYATDKGQDAGFFEVIGKANSMASPVFASPESQILASATAYSWAEVAAHPTLLAQGPMRIVGPNGEAINWTPPNVERFLELWEFEGEAATYPYRPLLTEIYFPSVIEHTSDGRVEQQLLIQPSLTDLLVRDTSSSTLFGDNPAAMGRYYATAEAKSNRIAKEMNEQGSRKGANPIKLNSMTRLINKFVIARSSIRTTTATETESEQVAKKTIAEFVTLQRLLGQYLKVTVEGVDPNTGESMRIHMLDQLREQLKADFQEKVLVTRYGNEKMLELARLATSAYEVNLGRLASEGVITQEQRVAMWDAAEGWLSVETTPEVVRAWSLRPEEHLSDGQVVARKRAIVNYLRHYPDAIGKVRWSNGAMKILDPSETKLRDPETGLVHMSEDMWIEASDAVVLMELSRQSKMSIAGRDIPNPLKNGQKDLRLYDPMRTYLLDDLLSSESPFIKAALEIAEEENISETVDHEIILQELMRGLFDPKQMTDWSDLEVNQILQAESRMDSSGAMEGVQMSGSEPVLKFAEAAQCKRDLEDPGAEMLSVATASMVELLGHGNSLIHVVNPTPLNQVMRLRTLAASRAASRVTIKHKGKVLREVFDDPYQQVGVTFANLDATAPYRFITLDRLNEYLSDFSKETAYSGIPISEMRVEIEFFNPECKPRELTNNVYFEGLGLYHGDMAPSLVSVAWFAADGGFDGMGTTRALSSSKKGTNAIVFPDLLNPQGVDDEMWGWQADMHAAIENLVAKVLTLNVGDGSHISEEFYNVIAKHFQTRFWVRAMTAEGKPVMLTSEQVIEAQQNMDLESLGINWDTAELYAPSEPLLKTIMGESSEKSEIGDPLAMSKIHASEFGTWTGVLSEEQLGFLAGALETDENGKFVEGDLFKTPAVSRSFIRTASTIAGFDKKTRDIWKQLQVRENTRADLISQARRRTTDASRDWLSKTREHAYPRIKQAIGGELYENLSKTPHQHMVESAIGQHSLFNSAIVENYERVTAKRDDAAAWIVRFKTLTGAEAKPGVVPANSLASHLEIGAEVISPGEDVALWLDDLAMLGSEAALNEVRDALLTLSDLGARVVLVSTTPTGRDLQNRASRWLQDWGYSRVLGSNSVFERTEQNTRTAAKQAHIDMLTNLQKIPTHDLMHVFHAMDLGEYGLSENGAWMMDSKTRRFWLRQEEDIPVTAYRNFTHLADPGNIQALKTEMSSEDMLKILKESTKKFWNHEIKKGSTEEASLQHAIDNLSKNLNGYGLYNREAQFNVGDFIPLVSTNGRQILLYRHGHTPPTPEVIAEMEASGDKWLIYDSKLLPSASTHDLTVRAMSFSEDSGLRISGWVPGSMYSGKLQVEKAGTKHLPIDPPRGFMLPVGINGWPIDLVVGMQDEIDKEGYAGRLDTFQNVFGYGGVDFHEELAKVFFGPSATEKDWPAAETILLSLARRLPKRSAIEVEALSQMANIPSSIANELRALKLENVADSLNENWFDSLTTEFDKASPEQQTVRNMLLYLMYDGAKISDIIQCGSLSHPSSQELGNYLTIPPVLFTQMFDKAPMGSSLRKYIVNKCDRTMFGPNSPYKLREDLFIEITVPALGADLKPMVDKNGQPKTLTYIGRSQFARVLPIGDDPVLDLQSQERKDKIPASPQQIAMAYHALDNVMISHSELKKLEKILSGESMTPLTTSSDLLNMLRNVPKETVAPKYVSLNPGQRKYLEYTETFVKQDRHPLDTTKWIRGTDGKQDEDAQNRYFKKRTDITNLLGWPKESGEIVDYWVRQMILKSVDPRIDGNPGDVDFDDAMGALKDIQKNLEAHQLPVTKGMSPIQYVFDLWRLHNSPKFELWNNPDDPNSKLTNWEDWVDHALSFGSDPSAKFDAIAFTRIDGYKHSYWEMGDLLGGPALSFSEARDEWLFDPKTGDLAVTYDTMLNRTLANPAFVSARSSLEEGMGGSLDVLDGLEWRGSNNTPSSMKRSLQRLRRSKKQSEIEPTVATTQIDAVRLGRQTRSKMASKHAGWRILHYLRITNATWNPLVQVGGWVDLALMGGLEDATTLLSGNSARTVWHGDKEGFNRWRSMVIGLSENSEFTDMFNAEVRYNDELFNASKVEKFFRATARLGGKWQDPHVSVKRRMDAQRYVEAVMSNFAAMGTMTNVTPDMIVANLHTDPHWVQKNNERIHNLAMQTVMGTRLMKDNFASKFIREYLDPAMRSSKGWISAPANLAKIPLMFGGFIANKTEQVLGLQFFNAAIAAALHGSDGPAAQMAGRWKAMLEGREMTAEDGVIDMTDVMTSYDLTNAFIKSGITHTSLLAFGVLAGGLTGEDDEDRRRRKAAMYHGYVNMSDPEEMVRDFRNKDTIYLDWWLPQMLHIDTLFKVGVDEEGNTVSAAKMNWLTRSILSPILGISRYINTGNPMEMWWGFMDAIGSAPLVNWAYVSDAFDAFSELQAAAKDESSKGDIDHLEKSYRLIVASGMLLEGMLLENTTLNLFYTGMDTYDRDPYALVQTDGSGEVTTNQLGLPDKTTALQWVIDTKNTKDTSDDEVKQVYKKRDTMDSVVRSYAENRLGWMSILSLAKGQIPLTSEYNRYNMLVKARSFEKPELTLEEAKEFIKAVRDSPMMLDESMLQGIYIPYEMRNDIRAVLEKEVHEEGAALGLSKFDTDELWRKRLYGDAETIGYNEILQSDKLSSSPRDVYYQRNTEYIEGPDGRSHPVGAVRNPIAQLLPLQAFEVGNASLPDVDSRLNTVDAVRGINTGYRGLEKVDAESFQTEEEKFQDRLIEAIKKAGQNNYDKNGGSGGSGWTNYGRRSYGGYSRGGGGGGGGSYSTSMRAPEGQQVPYANNIDSINMNTPLLRRASIRRERSDSEKGRLKPWQ